MSVAIVTGGTGFIGSNLTSKLLDMGWAVLVYGGGMKEQWPWKTGKGPIHCGRDFTGFRRHIFSEGVDVLFHMAAITDTTVSDEKSMYQVNVWDSLRLFENVAEQGCKQIVYASSCATYGDVKPPFHEDGPTNPLNVYGKSKLLLDQEAMQWGKASGVNIVGLRYSNVYGPHESHKGKMTCILTQIGTQMLTGRPRLFKWGEQKRDFVYVKDVVEYNLAAARFQGQEVCNAGSGTETSFNEVVGFFNDFLGLKRDPIYIDNPYAGKYQSHTGCDMTKAREKLGVKPSWSIQGAIQDYFKPMVP